MDWWITKGDRNPIGPVSTDLLLRGIGARKVPRDSLICEVGGSRWRGIAEVAPFSAAFQQKPSRRRLDSVEELTIADPPTSDEFLTQFEEETSEHTTVDRSPLRPSDPPPRPWLDRFEDVEEKTIVMEEQTVVMEEKTIVELAPPRTSEPPTET